MIIVKIRGGLGNQMLQYTFGEYIRKKYDDIEVLYDKSVFNDEKMHNGYELDRCFEGINVRQASPRELRKCHVFYEQGKTSLFYRMFRKISKTFYLIEEKKEKRIYDEFEWKTLSDSEKENAIKKSNIYLTGDWTLFPYYKKILGDDSHFWSFNENLLNENDLLWSERLYHKKSASIHVRGGDYLGSSFQLVDSLYYYKAIEMVKEMWPGIVFYVFTDDYEYAYKLLGDDYQYISYNKGFDSWKDMYLMSKSSVNIIANSTFSFWAAVLNQNEEKMIIAPDLRSEITDYYLSYDDDWIILDNGNTKKGTGKI